MIDIIISVVGYFLLITSGMCRAIFECLIYWDAFYKIHGWSYWWSWNLFESNKDRNHDGKKSFMEINFPNDGGHRIKLLEIITLMIGTVLIVLSSIINHNWLFVIINLIVGFAINGYVFSLEFDKYRKK